MENVTYPGNFFSQPFANSGTYKIVPDTKTASGRASLADGFPEENQLPLSHGGVAPNRMDINGILYMLSSFAFWQQSGGLWLWKDTLNYAEPSLVCHKKSLWWCKQASGPGVAAGPVEPGTNSNYWDEYLMHLFDSGTLKMHDPTPVGTVITYYGLIAPGGYLECDGRAFSASLYPELYALLGRASTPDFRGLFIRGYDPASIHDPSGGARGFASVQGDAIRNITGQVSKIDGGATAPNGAFYVHSNAPYNANSQNKGNGKYVHLDCARVVPTAAENRPKNVNLLYCIKHDQHSLF